MSFSSENVLIQKQPPEVLQMKACNFIKKRLQHMCFPVNIAKFLITPILKNIMTASADNYFLVTEYNLPKLLKFFLAEGHKMF